MVCRGVYLCRAPRGKTGGDVKRRRRENAAATGVNRSCCTAATVAWPPPSRIDFLWNETENAKIQNH
jgi:hypothetical protein